MVGKVCVVYMSIIKHFHFFLGVLNCILTSSIPTFPSFPRNVFPLTCVHAYLDLIIKYLKHHGRGIPTVRSQALGVVRLESLNSKHDQ